MNHIYVFFGKTGVLAFDLKGNQLWETSVGTGSGPMQFGSAASPLVYKNMVIVNASEESESLIALNKKTGKEVWKVDASALVGSWSTPILVETKEGNQELVINAPYEVWGMNPDTGKLVWYAEAIPGSAINPTLVAHYGVVYALGNRGGGNSAAIRTGGKGDVTKTHVLWTANLGSYVTSPVIHGGRLYWVSDQGQAYCLKADTGETVYRSRLSGRGACYASAVLADGKLFAVSRTNGTYVLALGEKFEQLARNEFEEDDTDFNASPAVSNGRLFLRSNQALYCIGEK
jgi:outer membrane protein assembly factor BamB